MFRIGYYQFCPQFGKVQKNLSTIVRALGSAKADLIVLPELALTGYYFAGRRECVALAQDPAGSGVVDTLVALCRARKFHLAIGFAEKKKDRCFNSALLLGPKGIVHTYRKLHLFRCALGSIEHLPAIHISRGCEPVSHWNLS